MPELKAVFAFFGAMLGVIVLFSWIGMNQPEPNPAFEIAFAGCFAVLVLAVLASSNTVTRRSFALDVKAHLPVVGLAFLVMAAFMFVYFSVLAPLTAEVEGSDINIAEFYLESGFTLLGILVLVAVFPAIFEELAFRGYIQTRLQRAFSLNEALLIQAVMFSLLHLSLLIFISHTVMGLIFGWLRYKTKSLTPAILLHFLWNGSVVLFDYWRM